MGYGIDTYWSPSQLLGGDPHRPCAGSSHGSTSHLGCQNNLAFGWAGGYRTGGRAVPPFRAPFDWGINFTGNDGVSKDSMGLHSRETNAKD